MCIRPTQRRSSADTRSRDSAAPGRTQINAIKAGPNGEVYVVGSTTSGDFPVKNAAQPESAEASAMRSIDLGRTWTRFNPPPASADPRFPEPTLLRAHPSVAGLLFAAVGPILWRSSDAGQTWQLVYTAEPGEESASGFIAAIGFDQRATTTVYLFSTDGFSTSGDAGMTWQTKPPVSHPSRIGVGPDQASQTKIDSDPRGSGALITRPDGNAILSRDGGGTWTTLRPPIDQTGSVATFSGARDGQIYAGVSAGASGSLWVSNDWGATWSQTKAQPNSAVVDLFTDPDAPNTLYVVTLGALRISDDGGQSWRNEPTFDFLSHQVTRVTGCSTSTALVTIRAANQLAISENRGDTWQNTHLRDVQRFTAGSGCSIYVLRAISGDAFVAKLDRSGAIEWSTYLGDLGSERLNAVTHDRAGNVIAVGGGDPFGDSLVAKYAPDGRLLWKKTVGGRYPDTLLDVVADQSGNIILGGRTTSDDLPVTPGAARREPGTGFAVKLKPDGEIVWATYLDAPASSLAVEPANAILIATWSSLLRLSPGGDSITPLNTIVRQPQIVRTDAAGNVFLTGIVPPAETPVTPGAYVSPIRARPCSQVSWGPPYSESTNDLQVARLRAGTLEPDFSALLGGECGTHADSLDIAPDGRVTVGFVTQSQAFDLRAPLASAGFCRGYDLGTGIAHSPPMAPGCSAPPCSTAASA
ncbi:MAG TPA: sialidase family protein [Bryobacteraceae bacterium]|nr:sialidase family protein [Bryobacteraceae bacterium]